MSWITVGAKRFLMFQVGAGVYKIRQKSGLVANYCGRLSNLTAGMISPLIGQEMTGNHVP
jgi:hypothetical protein